MGTPNHFRTTCSKSGRTFTRTQLSVRESIAYTNSAVKGLSRSGHWQITTTHRITSNVGPQTGSPGVSN
jgi:hypothetical protein